MSLVSLPPFVLERHRVTIELLAADLEGEFGPRLLGLLIGGSVGRGSAASTSDIDVFALVDVTWHQRRRRRIGGVQVDLFLDPPARAERLVARDAGAVLLDNYANGWIAYDPHGHVARICDTARDRHAHGRTRATPVESFAMRSRCDDLLAHQRDALAAEDELGFAYLAAALATYAVEAYYRVNGLWDPPPKGRMASLERADPAFCGALRGLLDGSAPGAERIQAATALLSLLFDGQTLPERSDAVGPRFPFPDRA